MYSPYGDTSPNEGLYKVTLYLTDSKGRRGGDRYAIRPEEQGL